MAPHEKFKVEITYREMMFFGDALSEVVVVKPCKVIALNIGIKIGRMSFQRLPTYVKWLQLFNLLFNVLAWLDVVISYRRLQQGKSQFLSFHGVKNILECFSYE